MKNIIILFLFLAACTSQQKTEVTPAPTPTPTPAPPVSGFPSSVKELPIPNTHVIISKNNGVALRGNGPRDAADALSLKNYGVSKVIIFKNDRRGEVKREISDLKNLGYTDEQITYIPFDWADNGDYKSGCEKFMQAFNLMDEALKKGEKSFLHCTTGEDRTGVASALYLLRDNKKLTVEQVFKNEMCARGYEGSNKNKPKDIVDKIRVGLTYTFLKMAYQINEYHKKGKKIDDKICLDDPTNDKKFIKSKYASNKGFICAQ